MLEVKKLSKKFNGNLAVNNISFKVENGKIFGFKEFVLPDNFKYVFSDFTFIFSIIFVACSFIVTEALLKVL